MCGIAGIVYNYQKDRAPLCRSLSVDQLDRFFNIEPRQFPLIKDLLTLAEPYMENIFDFSSFYEIYIQKDKGCELESLVKVLENVESGLSQYVNEIGVSISMEALEEINSVHIRVLDALWRGKVDILENVRKIRQLCNEVRSGESKKLIHELWKLNFILNNIDRLEVRGRDSAGLSCLVTFRDEASLQQFLENLGADLRESYNQRTGYDDFVNRSIIVTSDANNRKCSLIFTFKVAQEIGKMGDNVSALRRDIASDRLFLKSMGHEETFSNFFAHTRWASNGIINEQNCHPVSNETCPGSAAFDGRMPYIIAAVLNGDIDNFQELKEKYEALTGRKISENITTDTKIIPVVVDYYYNETKDIYEAFRRALNEFKGSMAIALHSSLEPAKVFLALRGSGQALFVGLIPNGYTYASELYGVVEGSSRFVKLDGEHERIPGDSSSQGQIYVLDQSGAGGLSSIRASFFDGISLDLTEENVRTAEITTRDINRGQYPHFLLKEISESPLSVEKTLRGKFQIVEEGKAALFNINEEIIPEIVVNKLKEGEIKKIILIGQGTASIAGDGIASFMARALASSNIQVLSTKSTELSGFLLEDNMSDVLAIAVSQSGTTTDTNRTVDLVKSRGSHVIAIVNRRNSDLVYKSDSVFYTSDGRDIEMSVASTKAFYSQIVAGTILSLYFAQILSTMKPQEIVKELKELGALPQKMHQVLSRSDQVKEIAAGCAVMRKYWAVVGSGPNRVAGNEIRIKLSELCYKSIASDTIEDKKHIDLSSEPLIIACIAGVSGSNLQDIVKEVSIFKAHKACPITIVTEGQEDLFKPYSSGILSAPPSSETGSVLLNTMYGHLFGYFAARAIEESADLFRTIRAILVEALGRFAKATRITLFQERVTIKTLSDKLYTLCREFYRNLRKGIYNSCLEVNNASQLNLIFKYLERRISLENFEIDFDIPGNFTNVLNEAIKYLSLGIADLTRPVDAIKHQAKTVTVGISRLEEIPTGFLFDALKEENVPLSNLSYQNIYVLQSISTAISAIIGSTKYEISGLDSLGYPCESTEIHTLTKSGIASQLTSRADNRAPLMGRKQSVVARQRVFVGTGNSDGRSIIIIPLVNKGVIQNLLLFHVEFSENIPVESKVELVKTLDKYDDIKYIITEMNLQWDDNLLDYVKVIDLITENSDTIASTISLAYSGV